MQAGAENKAGKGCQAGTPRAWQSRILIGRDMTYHQDGLAAVVPQQAGHRPGFTRCAVGGEALPARAAPARGSRRQTSRGCWPALLDFLPG